MSGHDTHIVTRDIATDPDRANNDSGDVVGASVDIDGTGGGSSSKSYVSAPATGDGKCVWTVGESGSQFTSRLHVANASWCEGNFSNTNANRRYFVRNNDTHEAEYETGQVVVGPIGNLRLKTNGIPTTSSAFKPVSGEIRTA